MTDYIYSKKERMAMRRKELKEYEAKIPDLTDEERKDLREWVAGDNSVYYNPYEFNDKNGYPLDFIEAVRTVVDMGKNPENYQSKSEPAAYVFADGIPF